MVGISLQGNTEGFTCLKGSVPKLLQDSKRAINI